MRKIVQIALGLFLLGGVMHAQVVADFEQDVNGFSDGDWGVFVTSIEQIADPTSQSGGVLAVHIDAAQTGGDPKDPVVAYGLSYDEMPAVLTYYVYLPADIPDNVMLKLFGQDNSWDWHDVKYYAKDIPKEVWYPISYSLEQFALAGSDYSGKLNGYGIEFSGWELSGDDTTWSGTVYIDNVTKIGVEPKVFADFEVDESGFADNGWGTGFTSVAKADDPSNSGNGVLKLDYNGANGKGVIQISNVDPEGNNLVAYYIYLPSDVPDSLSLKLWAQDNVNWGWTEKVYHVYEMKKEVWYPIYYDMEAMTADTSIAFDAHNNKIGKMGVEVAVWDEHDADASWTGSIYIDNVSLMGTEVGAKWVLADFEAVAGGVNNFAMASWGPAGVSLNRVSDPTSRSEGVLELGLDYGAGIKAYISRDGIQLKSDDTGEIAKAISIDVWVPTDFPTPMQFGAVFSGSANNWGWSEQKFMLTDSSDTKIVRGDWNTLTYDMSAGLADSTIDPTLTTGFGVQVYDPTESSTYTGSLYFDNLTIIGIPQPEGTLASPALQASVVDTVVVASGDTVSTIRFDWVDNTIGTEVYNIYMSESPITDLTADGVVKIDPGVPHGLQKYAFRPYTHDGAVQDYYFAITAMDAGVETGLTGENVVGPISVKTTPTMKVKYVANFADSFVLDGLDTEWENYKDYQITPETAGGDEGDAWTPESSDLNFKVALIIDDNYLYISGDVTDDDLRTDPTMQAWEGDALEFYMGFYDVSKLNAWHEKYYSHANGDWRFGFTARGEVAIEAGTGLSGGYPGIEATVFQKFAGDGYIIEARVALDSLAPSNTDFVVYNGMKLPLRIDNNDWDPQNGDDHRTLILQVGGTASASDIDMNEDWKRPHAWGMLEVIDGPTAVASEDNGLPKEFKLYNNYPNPFNPTTNIKYDLPKEVNVNITVYNILGERVATLVNQVQPAGKYNVPFNASALSSGTYILRITAGNYVNNKKMMLLK